MAKICRDCKGNGTVKVTKTERVWNPRTKTIKIVVKEYTETCLTCNGWGSI